MQKKRKALNFQLKIHAENQHTKQKQPKKGGWEERVMKYF